MQSLSNITFPDFSSKLNDILTQRLKVTPGPQTTQETATKIKQQIERILKVVNLNLMKFSRQTSPTLYTIKLYLDFECEKLFSGIFEQWKLVFKRSDKSLGTNYDHSISSHLFGKVQEASYEIQWSHDNEFLYSTPIMKKRDAPHSNTPSTMQILFEKVKKDQDGDLLVLIDEKKFYLHSCVAKAQSEYFQGILNNPMKESVEKKIVLKECCPEIFEKVQEFIYLENVTLPEDPIEQIQILIELISKANFFRIQKLMDWTTEKLVSYLTQNEYSDDTISNLFQLGVQIDDLKILEICCNLIETELQRESAIKKNSIEYSVALQGKDHLIQMLSTHAVTLCRKIDLSNHPKFSHILDNFEKYYAVISQQLIRE